MIFEKLVHFKKYGVAAFLAAVSCFSGFCDPSDSGDGIHQDYVQICYWYWDEAELVWRVACQPTAAPGGTNTAEICTNCTAMTSEQCQRIKSELLEQYDYVYGSWLNATLKEMEMGSRIGTISMFIDMLRQQGDYLQKYTISEIPGVSVSEKIGFFQNQIMSGPYLEQPNLGSDPLINLEAYNLQNSAIYNYYDNFVKQVLDIAQPELQTLDMDRMTLNNNLSRLSETFLPITNAISSMNCDTCQYVNTPNPGGGSGVGGCPCAETINGVRYAVENCKTVLDGLKETLDKWDEKLPQFEQWIKTIVDNIAPIGTNFVRAVEYKTLDGVSFTMDSLDKSLRLANSGFDFGEFGNLSWYSRVEYLLMSIAGVFSATNREDDLTSGKMDSQYSAIADKNTTIENSVDSIGQKFSAVHQSLNGFFSAFRTGFGSGSNQTIHLLSNWIGDQPLEFTINSTVADGCRACTSLVWTVMFTMLLWEIILYFWKFTACAIWFWVRHTTAFVK